MLAAIVVLVVWMVLLLRKALVTFINLPTLALENEGFKPDTQTPPK